MSMSPDLCGNQGKVISRLIVAIDSTPAIVYLCFDTRMIHSLLSYKKHVSRRPMVSHLHPSSVSCLFPLTSERGASIQTSCHATVMTLRRSSQQEKRSVENRECQVPDITKLGMSNKETHREKLWILRRTWILAPFFPWNSREEYTHWGIAGKSTRRSQSWIHKKGRKVYGMHRHVLSSGSFDW
jgi:hypothetical protein